MGPRRRRGPRQHDGPQCVARPRTVTFENGALRNPRALLLRGQWQLRKRSRALQTRGVGKTCSVAGPIKVLVLVVVSVFVLVSVFRFVSISHILNLSLSPSPSLNVNRVLSLRLSMCLNWNLSLSLDLILGWGFGLGFVVDNTSNRKQPQLHWVADVANGHRGAAAERNGGCRWRMLRLE